jgi:hypothetical protein
MGFPFVSRHRLESMGRLAQIRQVMLYESWCTASYLLSRAIGALILGESSRYIHDWHTERVEYWQSWRASSDARLWGGKE